MVVISLLSSILLATAAFAFPTSIASRSSRRPSWGLQLTEASRQAAANATSNTSYSNNWAGAALDYPDGTFTSVTGTFKVPTPQGINGGASVWVGIDGDTCSQAILQTGVTLILKNGEVSFKAWYEWLPQNAVFFDSFSINAGDEIRLTVTATSTNGGIAKIENLTTNQQVQQVFQSESTPLCLQNAEWIVEDYAQNNVDVPFCNFRTVKFTNAYATTTANKRVTPGGAKMIVMQKNAQAITSVEANQDSVTITYL